MPSFVTRAPLAAGTWTEERMGTTHYTQKKSPTRGRGLKDISKVRLVNEYIPAERILDLASLYSSDVVVELERLRTALAVAISIDSLFL